MHTIKACGGNKGLAPPILNLNTRWRWGPASFIWLLYCHGKRPQHASSRMLGGWQGWSGCLEERDISCFHWESSHNFAAVQLVANRAVLAPKKWGKYSSELTLWLPSLETRKNTNITFTQIEKGKFSVNSLPKKMRALFYSHEQR